MNAILGIWFLLAFAATELLTFCQTSKDSKEERRRAADSSAGNDVTRPTTKTFEVNCSQLVAADKSAPPVAMETPSSDSVSMETRAPRPTTLCRYLERNDDNDDDDDDNDAKSESISFDDNYDEIDNDDVDDYDDDDEPVMSSSSSSSFRSVFGGNDYQLSPSSSSPSSSSSSSVLSSRNDLADDYKYFGNDDYDETYSDEEEEEEEEVEKGKKEKEEEGERGWKEYGGVEEGGGNGAGVEGKAFQVENETYEVELDRSTNSTDEEESNYSTAATDWSYRDTFFDYDYKDDNNNDDNDNNNEMMKSNDNYYQRSFQDSNSQNKIWNTNDSSGGKRSGGGGGGGGGGDGRGSARGHQGHRSHVFRLGWMDDERFLANFTIFVWIVAALVFVAMAIAVARYKRFVFSVMERIRYSKRRREGVVNGAGGQEESNNLLTHVQV